MSSFSYYSLSLNTVIVVVVSPFSAFAAIERSISVVIETRKVKIVISKCRDCYRGLSRLSFRDCQKYCQNCYKSVKIGISYCQSCYQIGSKSLCIVKIVVESYYKVSKLLFGIVKNCCSGLSK